MDTNSIWLNRWFKLQTQYPGSSGNVLKSFWVPDNFLKNKQSHFPETSPTSPTSILPPFLYSRTQNSHSNKTYGALHILCQSNVNISHTASECSSTLSFIILLMIMIIIIASWGPQICKRSHFCLKWPIWDLVPTAIGWFSWAGRIVTTHFGLVSGLLGPALELESWI